MDNQGKEACMAAIEVWGWLGLSCGTCQEGRILEGEAAGLGCVTVAIECASGEKTLDCEMAWG